MRLSSLIFVILLAARPSPALAQANAWWAHVKVLADDSMRGRETGTAEHRKAAEYVAGVFQRAGLRPGGTNGYFQPVRLWQRSIDQSHSTIAIVHDGHTTPFIVGTEAAFLGRTLQSGHIEGPLVFVGYGLQIPEYDLDNLQGLDLHGKIAIFLGAPPRGVPGPVVSDARRHQQDMLRQAGAIGTLQLYGVPKPPDIPWSRMVASRLGPLGSTMVLADSKIEALSRFGIVLRGDLGEQLFTNGPHPYSELLALADSGRPLPAFDLPVRLQATVAATVRPVVSDNIVGILPGRDGQLRSEYVVLTAHVDHLGVGEAIAGDSIYNGLFDNASGTATLLEVAVRLASDRRLPRRSLVFLVVTAEEKGLLGSRYFVEHPTVPIDSIVAALNVDVGGGLIPFSSVIVNGLEESDLADDARHVGQAQGIPVLPDPEPARNAFIRSDQYSFIERGIPALWPRAGFAIGTPEYERVRRYRADDYHAPSDDLAQPVDRTAAEGFLQYYRALVLAVADRPTRPTWYPGSPFRHRVRPLAP